MWEENKLSVGELVGKRIASVSSDSDRYPQADDDEVYITTDCGKRYWFHHVQDCCEHVRLAEVHGSFEDLVDQVVLEAYESTEEGDPGEYDMSSTWTFYRITTIRGTVTMRWLGESNGYYSEKVCFERD